jgi:3-dehydroquinate synthetase/shikimate kinase
VSARRDLVLAGPMGSGKTTVGRLVAAMLERAFVDLDARIEALEQRSIPALFAAGEPVFRAAEERAARLWLARSSDAWPEVLAVGGGTLENAALAEALGRRAAIVHLDAPAGELAARLAEHEVATRPLLVSAADRVAQLEALRRERAAGYARADVRLDTAGAGPRDVAVRVLRALYADDAGPWAGRARELAPGLPSARGVTIGRGALPFPPVLRAAMLWDAHLPACHRDALRGPLAAHAPGGLAWIEVPGGEPCKTPETLARTWGALLEAGLDKDMPLWAAGGGTITDLAGLAAATFKRGVPLALLPTTLLAQLDAALGGKNGINLAGAKNAVGTVRLPDRVHLDPLFLLTLPPPELAAGMAEAVKSALIGDAELLDAIEEGAAREEGWPLPRLEEVASRAARVKLEIVDRDLEERDERRKLNLGHTLGHALETATRAREVPLAHGEAVAIGTAFALELADRVGLLRERPLLDRIPALFHALGLPSVLPALDAAEKAALAAALAHDKKRAGGEQPWVLPVRAGEVVIAPVPASTVDALLAEELA